MPEMISTSDLPQNERMELGEGHFDQSVYIKYPIKSLLELSLERPDFQGRGKARVELFDVREIPREKDPMYYLSACQYTTISSPRHNGGARLERRVSYQELARRSSRDKIIGGISQMIPPENSPRSPLSGMSLDSDNSPAREDDRESTAESPTVACSPNLTSQGVSPPIPSRSYSQFSMQADAEHPLYPPGSRRARNVNYRQSPPPELSFAKIRQNVLYSELSSRWRSRTDSGVHVYDRPSFSPVGRPGAVSVKQYRRVVSGNDIGGHIQSKIANQFK